MDYVPSKRIHKQEEGPVPVECTNSPLPVGVSRGNRFIEPPYEVDTHSFSWNDQINHHAFVMRMLVQKVDHRNLQESGAVYGKQTKQRKTASCPIDKLGEFLVTSQSNFLHFAIQVWENLSKEKRKALIKMWITLKKFAQSVLQKLSLPGAG